jgi:hypothetical protein
MRRRDALLGVGAVLLAGHALGQERARVARPGDRVTTPAGAEAVFLVGRDVMLLREKSHLDLVEDGFRLVTGAVLAVFAHGQRRELRTPTATIGIRGTAVYLEIQPGRTYVCTCYGEAVLGAADEPAARETIRTRHHGHRYVMARGAPMALQSETPLNHRDAELERLERLLRS